MSPRKVPKEGAEGLFPHGRDKGKLAEVRVGGKRLKARLPTDPPIRDRTPDEYCGDPPKGDAA